MAKCVNALDGFTLSDLTTEDGLVFEIGDEYQDVDQEEFSYSPSVPLTNDEVLNLLNMDDFQDDDYQNDPTNDDKDVSVTLCGISFEKLKPKMTDIIGNGKIMKLLKQKGVGETIPYDAQVTIKYMGHFEYRDEPFDSSFARGGAETFHLNRGMLIPGLEIAITSMAKHEIAVFIIHPDLAYGKYGCAPRIPPNEEILFIVHLIDFVDNGSVETLKNLSIEERKIFANVAQLVKAKFNSAKDSFSKHKIKQAIREYSKAVQWLEDAELKNQEEEDEMKRLLSRGYSNLAVCYNMENMPRRACSACNSVPIPTAKTYFNNGRALIKMGEYTQAMEKLQRARKMEPNNEDIIKEIRLANEKHRKYLDVQKQLWENCLKNEPKEGKHEETSFQTVVREMCETFFNDSQLLRQPLPESLTPEEEKYIRQQAAAFGLIVTNHKRYGKEIIYLNKPNY